MAKLPKEDFDFRYCVNFSYPIEGSFGSLMVLNSMGYPCGNFVESGPDYSNPNGKNPLFHARDL